jgi:hypothetical protein
MELRGEALDVSSNLLFIRSVRWFGIASRCKPVGLLGKQVPKEDPEDMIVDVEGRLGETLGVMVGMTERGATLRTPKRPLSRVFAPRGIVLSPRIISAASFPVLERLAALV